MIHLIPPKNKSQRYLRGETVKVNQVFVKRPHPEKRDGPIWLDGIEPILLQEYYPLYWFFCCWPTSTWTNYVNIALFGIVSSEHPNPTYRNGQINVLFMCCGRMRTSLTHLYTYIKFYFVFLFILFLLFIFP